MLRRGDRYEDKDRDGNGFMVGVFVQGCVCCSVRLTEMQWAFWRNGDTEFAFYGMSNHRRGIR